jgi:hypothetical protein
MNVTRRSARAIRRGTLRCAMLASALVLSCASGGTEPASQTSATRSYRMGFSSLPPRLSIAEVLRTADEATKHADAALMVLDIPWAALLADTSASLLVRRDQLPLATILRQKGIPLAVTLEPANGLDRGAESAVLVSLGRSITEPAVQRAYREYVVAFDSIVHPTWLNIAVETNLIRAASRPAVYSALVAMSNAAAAQLRATGSATKLMVSVQVDVAWGRLSGTGGTFVGVQRDRTDFPFVEVLGLSSYPYLAGFTSPEQLPLDYYSRLASGAPIPMMVMEGGWTSASVTGVTSSPELQARYIRRQMQLADSAKLLGVFQITFTDLDLASFGVPAGSILPLFAQIGLVDANYRAKPALAVWDSVRATPLAAP